MLSDSPHKQVKKSKRDRAINAKVNRQWSDNQKMEAVKSYLVLGNLAMTSRILGIPEITIRVWKNSEWWKTAVAELKAQERIELTSRLKKIVDASLTVVEDRLLNGDYQYDQKTGETVRKPVNMRDAHRVAVDLQQRQEVLDKLDKPIETSEDTEARLEKLAAKFADLAAKKVSQIVNDNRTIEAEDIEYVEEVDDETDDESGDDSTPPDGVPSES